MQLKYIADYYETIMAKYPTLTRQLIKRILNYGWKLLYLLNSYGGDTLIKNKNFWMYTGVLTNNSLKHFDYYIKKLIIRLRVMYVRKHILWNGYYYFALTSNELQFVDGLKNKRGRKKKYFNYGNQILFKIYDECKVAQHNKLYIYKIPWVIGESFTYYKEPLITDLAELIEVREPATFQDILVTNNKYLFL